MTDRRTPPRRPPGRAALALLALLVLLLSAAVVAVPRLLDQATTGELRAALDDLAPERRDLVATLTTAGLLGAPFDESAPSSIPPEARPVFGALDQALEEFRSEQRAPLGALLGPAQFTGFSIDLSTASLTPERDDPLTSVRFAVDPSVSDRIRIVEGRMPEPLPPLGSAPHGSGPGIPAIELVLSTATAERMRWAVGEEWVFSGGGGLRLVGLFEAADADAPYWQRVTSVLEPEVFDDGNSPLSVTGTGYIDPRDVETFVGLSTVLAWFPIELDGLAIQTAPELAGQLRTIGAAPTPLDIEGASTAAARFETDAVAVVDEVLDRSSATAAVLAMLAAGPIGVLASAIVMSALTVVARRRPTIELMADRGASGLRLRFGMAALGLAIGLPAAVAGAALGALLPAALTGGALAVPTAPPIVALLVVAAVGPAIVLGIAGGSLRAGRLARVSGALSASALRWVVEVVVVLLAVAAVVVLLVRGAAGSGATATSDPLLVSAPLLAALAASALALRAYPLVVRAAGAIAGRRGSAVDQVGAARAARDRVGVLPATFALVVAVTVGAFSSGVLAAIDGAIDSTARDEVGASIRVSGFGLAPGDAARVVAERAARLEGVAAVSAVSTARPLPVLFGGERATATVFVVDDAIGAVRDDLPAGWPSTTAASEGEPLPVVLSAALLDDERDAPAGDGTIDGFTVGPADAEAVAVGRASSGYGARDEWVLVGAADAEALGISIVDPDLVLVDLAEPGDAAATEAIIAELLAVAPEGARATTSAAAAHELRASPTTALLRTGLGASTIVVALLAVIVIGLAIVASETSRRRAAAVLGAFGARPGNRLVAWQLVPSAVVAGAVGLVLGGALPLLVIAAVDLRAVTGSDAPPAVGVDPVVLLASAGALAIVVAGLTVIGARRDRRAPMSSTLRSETS